MLNLYFSSNSQFGISIFGISFIIVISLLF